MSSPGWYPDPSGQPNSFRYWNGQSWSHETSPTPYVGPPPSAAAPPQPPPPPPAQPTQPARPMPVRPPPPAMSGYGAGTGGPGWQPTPQPRYGGPPPSGGSGTKVALILLAVLLIAGAAVGGFFGIRALTDDSRDSSATDETSESSSPSQSESEDESESPSSSEATTVDPTPSEPTARPPAITAACTGASPDGGRSPGALLHGGGLTLQRPDGFEPMAVESAFTFADKVSVVARQIEEQWIAVYAVGGVPTAAFSGPDQAAETVLACMAASGSFYRNFESRTDVDSAPITVGGYDGWRITSEVRIDDPEIDQEGDHATVIVVETDSPGHYGLFVSVVPLGDQAMIAQQESVIGSLEVSGPPA